MAKTKSVLKAIERKITVSNGDAFNPQEYYAQDRKGLYVYSSFKERILPKARPVRKGTKVDAVSFSLIEYATDEKIEEALGKKHLFSETDVCVLIAELISKQAKGEKGILVNTGYANLFYTSAFVVYVDWGGGGWRVGAWYRGGGEWGTGGRVFSPAN